MHAIKCDVWRLAHWDGTGHVGGMRLELPPATAVKLPEPNAILHTLNGLDALTKAIERLAAAVEHAVAQPKCP